MQVRISVLAALIGLTACGDDGGAVGPIDAPSIDAVVLPSTCDPVAQDCPGGYKCTIVEAGLLVHRCVLATGTMPEGGTCTGFGGSDACAAGLMCLDGRCQAFCGATADCGASQGCAYFRNGDGFCKDTCAPFGTTCPANWSCTFMDERVATQARTIAGCRPNGTAPTGGQCFNDALPSETCGANHQCGSATALECTPLCDPTHPCASGTCTQPTNITSNPTQAGACL